MNNNLQYVFDELNKKKIDAYYLNLSNEHLYEFTKFKENYLYELTGFTGDTGSVLITKAKAYLFVDGRFTIQAKKEVNDKRIKIVEISSGNDKIDFIYNNLKYNSKLLINPKLISISKVNNAKKKLNIKKIKLIFDTYFCKKKFTEIKKLCFSLTCSPLFLLDNKYVGESSLKKINKLIKNVNCDNKFIYVTSSLEEIAYLTNIRFELCNISDESVLFDSFMIVGKKKSYLYIKDYFDSKDLKTLNKNGIVAKNIDEFYTDLSKLSKSHTTFLDDKINNFYIYQKVYKNNLEFIDSPIELDMSVKNNTQIKNLEKCNILDGISIVKAIYQIKKDIFNNSKNKKFNNEYDVKKYVDETRVRIGKSKYLCPSFETIVAYKENSAICHYIPKKNKCKNIKPNSLLLIDSGGNYLLGTTDITRTISLYLDKKDIPIIIKKHYSLVLNSLINLSILKFPSGLTGSEIDIIARKNLYGEYIDFNHGTGHGIGYISNVHEGPNRIGPGIYKSYLKNELFPYQLTSNEPGIYLEGKYGIRLENDILTVPIKSNEYGDYLGFKTMTLCPFDMDLIDKKYLSNEAISFLNEYNKIVYKKLSRYLNYDEKKWLKKVTREV